MGKPIEALVESTLLAWARKSAGFETEDAAKRARVPMDMLVAWEHGERRPTVTQLRALGKVYRRPLAIFYLPEPPKDWKPLRDFRRLPGQVAGIRSPELTFEIRRAHDRRALALELIADLDETPPTFALHATLTDDPERRGGRMRETLGIASTASDAGLDRYAAFNRWRDACENVGVLVFQASDVDPSEARGFSLADHPLPAAVVNMKEHPHGRLFTLLHEVVHILLRRDGLCDLVEDTERPPEADRVEVFCNRVAGATLVPRESLLAEGTVRAHGRNPDWSDDVLLEIGRRYGVSREVVLRRLLLLGHTTQAFYEATRRRYLREYAGRPKPGGFAPPHLVALGRVGPRFARLVLEASHRERITLADVAECLEVRLKHVPKIEAKILGAPVET